MKKYYVKVDDDGSVRWYKDAACQVLHREDGPAVTRPDGAQIWFKNDLRHRVDGPAVILANGLKSWWINGKRHREDGPAVIRPSGIKEWWLHDEEVTEEEFLKRTRPVEELTVAQIEQLLGKRVKIVK